MFRRMRRSLTDVDSEIGHAPASLDQLAAAHVSRGHPAIETAKARTDGAAANGSQTPRATENISAAVLSHLSSGVVFFNTAGLVRQANKAAKKHPGL